MQDAEARAGVVPLQATGYQRGQPPSETQRAARQDLTQDHRETGAAYNQTLNF